jgi:hypothetical protein
MPIPPDTSHWSEYDWERYLRESDRYAAHFFTLLKRFCDLPGARELVARRMRREFKGDVLDCNFDCDSCDHRLNCEFSSVDPMDEEPLAGGGGPDEDDDEDTGGDGDSRPPAPGDPLFYETDPTFVLLRQTAIGWCNVYAAILPSDARPLGLKVLFHIGRALANIAYSIGDGLYEQRAASIALGKRALDQLNRALGELRQLIQENPRLEKILQAMNGHLLQCQESLGDHLAKCRKRRRGEKPDA